MQPMQDVPNITQIVDQIDHAADLVTAMMRLHGWLLRPGDQDVPLQDEVDSYLRRLVVEAFYAFNDAKQEAKEDGQNPNDWEIEGYSGDDRLFDITVTGLADGPRGSLTAQIYLRLA